MTRLAAVAAVLLAGNVAARAATTSLGAVTGFNVFTLSNFSGTSDSEGRVAVGGDFNSAGFSIASHHASDGSGVYNLVVGGNFTMSNYSLGGGDAFIGGNMNWTNPTLPRNAYVNGNVSNPGGGSAGGSIFYHGTYTGPSYMSHTFAASPTATPIDFLSARTSLESLSSTLGAQTANGTVSVAYNTFTLIGSNAVNIFNLTDANYSGATFNISAPAGSTVIVNVAGTAASFTYGSINLNGITANNVIFNFSSANSLALNGIGFNGTILAPYASFLGTYGNVNGQVIAKSISGSTEFHEYLFSGALPESSSVSSVPEPSSWMMMACGGCAIVFARRKRR